MIYKIRQEYERNLYVGREQELELAQKWWDSKKRLLSVTAPPATGKTWFLRKVEEIFIDESIVCFWLDVKELLLLPEESIARSSKQNPALVDEWLKKLVDIINQRCSGQLEGFTIEKLEQLAPEIGNLCQSEQGICFFIDDGDRFDDSGWREFERKILEPLAKEKSLRFVIAVREKRVLKTIPLRISEERIKLKPLTQLVGEQQINRIREQKSTTSSYNIEGFLRILQDHHYDLIHPGLNKFICLFAEENPQAVSNFNVAAIFNSALEAVYPESQNDINSLVALLYHLSLLGNEWDIEDLVEKLQVSRQKAWDYIQFLKEHSLIKQNLNRYEIVIGVREFVRAIIQGKPFYAVMPGVAIDLPDKFHHKMDKWLTVEELKKICSDLGIDPENALVGETKLSRVITLIQYCERRNRLAELIAACQRLHPQVDWSQ